MKVFHNLSSILSLQVRSHRRADGLSAHACTISLSYLASATSRLAPLLLILALNNIGIQ